MIQALLPRFPGSKRKLLGLIDDGGQYDAIVEPFTGGGAATLHLLARVGHAYLADSDRSIRAVWHCWSQPEMHPLVYAHLEHLRREALVDTPTLWAKLKAEFKAADTTDPARLAAVSLLIRQLTFGGVVRTGPGGHLNIKWVQGQVDLLPRWRYRFPTFPPDAHLSLSHGWEDAIACFEDSSHQAAIALVDPPYWSPARVTPAYPGHQPQAPETLQLCVDAVARLARNPRVKRLVVANYWSDVLNIELSDIAKSAGHPVAKVVGGHLDGMNKGRASGTQNRDALWVIGRSRIQQLALWAS